VMAALTNEKDATHEAPSLRVCHWIWWNTMLVCDLVFDIVVEVDDVVTS
jgi:hypothetical protein